jgi:hypothetical protein
MGLTAVFSSLQLINILHHAMWRDELQVWMIARHSHSIAELIALKRYEGQPDAWFLFVYLITRITHHPIWMQLFHGFVASITAYVIARYSPFTRLQKILIVFGYFLFFEYATISREYALGVLGIFLFCAVFRPGPRKNYLLLALLLLFVCQTSIYGAIVAISFILAMLFEAIGTSSWRQSAAPLRWQLPLATTIAAALIGVTVLHMRPSPEAGYTAGLPFRIKGLSNSLSIFWMSFVPIPQLTRTFWNTNILQVPGVLFRFMALMGVVVFCVSVLFFLRKPIVLCAYVCGAAGLFLFKQFVFRGYMRHDGLAFILFLACLWLASSFPEKRFRVDRVERVANWFAPLQVKVLFVFLAIQTAVGLAASGAALKIPFSQARATAEFIRSNEMDQWPIIGDEDYLISPIAGYLDRDVYYVAGNRPGSFILWDKKRELDSAGPVMPFAAKIAAEQHQKVLVILSYPSDTFGEGVSEIASFKGAIVRDENYYLYVVQPIPNPSTQNTTSTSDFSGVSLRPAARNRKP